MARKVTRENFYGRGGGLKQFEKWTKLSPGVSPRWKIHSPAPLTRSPPAPDSYAAPRSCCDTVRR